jgi:molybdopterin-guanine dinucleotide biosynthesis protein A
VWNNVETSVIILAGGRSRRLGRDKVWEKVGSRSLLARVVASVVSIGSEVIVVTADATVNLPAVAPDVRIVSDLQPGTGPLGGIYTGLRASNTSSNLVVAADMPFLNQPLLRYMIGLAADVDVVVPRIGEMMEPLHAVYGKSCVEPIERLLKQGESSVRRLFPLVMVRYVAADEIARFDPQMASFFNINTMEDMRRARALLERNGNDD